METIIYWTATLIIAVETLVGGVLDVMQLVSATWLQLGYPLYLLQILGIWKILGAIVLLLPGFPRLKEWAYAGIIFELTSAAVSYVAQGSSLGDTLIPLLFVIVTFVSWALRPPSRILESVFSTKKSSYLDPNDNLQ